MLFVESTPFRRLAFYLTSPEFFAKHDDNGFSESDNRRYLRSVTRLRGHLRTLQRALDLESGSVAQAVNLTEVIYSVLPKLMESAGSPSSEDLLNSFEKHVQELGQIAESAAPESTSDTGSGQSMSVTVAHWGAASSSHGQDAEGGERVKAGQPHGGSGGDLPPHGKATDQSAGQGSFEAAGGGVHQTGEERHGGSASASARQKELTHTRRREDRQEGIPEYLEACEKIIAASATRHAVAAAIWGAGACVASLLLCYIALLGEFSLEGLMIASYRVEKPIPAEWIIFKLIPLLPLFVIFLASLQGVLRNIYRRAQELQRLQSLALWQAAESDLPEESRGYALYGILFPVKSTVKGRDSTNSALKSFFPGAGSV